MTEAGKLYIVATPIGNLGDLSARARQVLGEAAVVAAEDTRHTGRLLAGLAIERPLLSLHEHNERSRTPQLLQRLRAGESIALVSDAGTPLVSDPGFVVARAAGATAATRGATARTAAARRGRRRGARSALGRANS